MKRLLFVLTAIVLTDTSIGIEYQYPPILHHIANGTNTVPTPNIGNISTSATNMEKVNAYGTPNMRKPTSDALFGATRPAISVIKIGKRMRVVLDTFCALYGIRMRLSFFVVSSLITGG